MAKYKVAHIYFSALLLFLNSFSLAINFETQVFVLVFLIIALGIPHGAYDYQVAKRMGVINSRYHIAVFYTVYIGLVFFSFYAWYSFPFFSLLAFLLLSSWHFGSDWVISRNDILTPILIGFFVGLLSAMMGVGGGFIMIPAMVYILGMSTNVVVGTSLFQIIFVTANSTFFQSYLNQTVDIILASLMIIGGVIGAQIGARIGSKLKAEYLRGILAIIVLMVCAKIFTDLTLTPENLFSLQLL